MVLRMTALVSLRRLEKCLWWMMRSWESLMYAIYWIEYWCVIFSSAVLISTNRSLMPSSWWTVVPTRKPSPFFPSTCKHDTPHNILLTRSAQLPKSSCKDLFKDRYVSCLWGRLACELLIGDLEEAHGDIKLIEQVIQQNESSLPASQILQCRCWLLHCGLYLLARHEEGVDLFIRTFIRRE